MTRMDKVQIGDILVKRVICDRCNKVLSEEKHNLKTGHKDVRIGRCNCERDDEMQEVRLPQYEARNYL